MHVLSFKTQLQCPLFLDDEKGKKNKNMYVHKKMNSCIYKYIQTWIFLYKYIQEKH